MSLLRMRAALLSYHCASSGPPAGAYQPPTADSLALVFAVRPYTAPDNGAISLSFGPPPASASGPYAPPDASDLPLRFTGGAFTTSPPDALILEF